MRAEKILTQNLLEQVHKHINLLCLLWSLEAVAGKVVLLFSVTIRPTFQLHKNCS